MMFPTTAPLNRGVFIRPLSTSTSVNKPCPRSAAAHCTSRNRSNLGLWCRGDGGALSTVLPVDADHLNALQRCMGQNTWLPRPAITIAIRVVAYEPGAQELAARF
jgi:hypothetical protein